VTSRASGASLAGALADVSNERYRQERLKYDGRFTYTCADSEMTDPERLAVLVEEVGEAGHEVNEGIGDHAKLDRAKLRKELVQVAAVAVAWIEELDGRPT